MVEIIAFPVAGTVQQLSVHTIGGVVTPAQALLVVVPGDSHLEIEAMVLNRDIGFVQAGQDAQIKIDTFNFSRYGLRWAVLPLLDGAAVKRGEIENGIVIAVHSNSFHTVRGRTLVRSAASRTSFNEAAAVMPRKIGLSIHPHPATRLASMRPRLAMPRN